MFPKTDKICSIVDALVSPLTLKRTMTSSEEYLRERDKKTEEKKDKREEGGLNATLAMIFDLISLMC